MTFKTCHLPFQFYLSLHRSMYGQFSIIWSWIHSFWFNCDSGTAGSWERFTFQANFVVIIGYYYFLNQAALSFSGWQEERKAWSSACSSLPLPGSLQAWHFSFSLGYPSKTNGQIMSWLQFCFKFGFTWPPSWSPFAHLLLLRTDNYACVV